MYHWKRIELWIRQVALRRVVGVCRPLLFHLAYIWRRLLPRTTFIAVTGSHGKTTATRLIAAALATAGRTYHTAGNQNGGVLVALNILRVRPWHRYAVIEIGIDKPGAMEAPARAVRPDVAVVLGVAEVHTTGFENREAYTEEKAKLLCALAPGGVAVLNGADPRVAAMAGRTGERTCLFGDRAGFDVWGEALEGRWPDRLSCRVHRGTESVEIRTMLLGSHWVGALTAAAATAGELGIPIAKAAARLGQVPPHTARMEPVQLPNGVVMIRDDYSNTVGGWEASLEFLREARAGRRVLAVTDISDAGVNRRHRLRNLASAVAGWLDLLVLVGAENRYGVRKATEAGMAAGRAHGFDSLRGAAEFLKTELRAGDLVLLKGRSTDHAGRLFYAQCGSLGCWDDYCRKTMLCDACWELGFQPSGDFVPSSLGRMV
jgi:UDP-N-acetylmuramoyl-tripeptide--D-alanyl-D-alanine ligase